MTKVLSEAAEQALAEFRHHQALVLSHTKFSESALNRFIEALNANSMASQIPSQVGIKCVRVWTDWLQENGPELKSVITFKTGVRFKEQGTPYTIKWADYLEDRDTEHVPDDLIVRFPLHREGRGGAQVIYALWSQRYDVYPKFGVGPRRPSETEPLLGVIQPDDEGKSVERYNLAMDYGLSDAEAREEGWPTERRIEERKEPNTPDAPVRFATLREWHAAHTDTFQAARLGAKLPPEEKQLLRDTCPEGVDPLVAMALAAAGRTDDLFALDNPGEVG